MSISEVEWIDGIKKKIQYMANNVWDGITYTEVEEFMTNFSKKDQIVGWALLDMLIYYSNEQEESIISNLIRLVKRDIWITQEVEKRDISSQNIEKAFSEIFEKMCFVPVDESDTSASSFNITGQFKKSRAVPNIIEYIKLMDVPLMIAMHYKYFIFYDDIIGTGTQFSRFWKKRQFGNSKKYSLIDLVENNPDACFYYLVFGGYQEGIDKIKKKIPKLKIIVSEYFPKNADILNEENEYWELNPQLKKKVIDYIMEKEKELDFTDKYSKHLPVLFQHGRASNTALSLYWNSKDSLWHELYKR